jgi:uncharacterized protein (DUF2267 family)
MLEHHVRRIPIVDGGLVAGIITLDDLILEQTVAPGLAAEIVRAQLAEPRRHKRAGETHPTRRKAPAGSPGLHAAPRGPALGTRAYDALIRCMQNGAGVQNRERVEAAVEEVLSVVLRGITPAEAEQLIAQLPSVLRERLAHAPRGPDRGVTRATLEQAVANRLGIDRAHAGEVVLVVCDALGATISSAKFEDVQSRLPADLKNLFAPIAIH